MFYKEHEPPHFHSEHQGQQAKFDFAGKLIAGQFQSRTALRLIREWSVLDRAALENWVAMKLGQHSRRFPRWSDADAISAIGRPGETLRRLPDTSGFQ